MLFDLKPNRLILLIDDDSDYLVILKYLLDTHGFTDYQLYFSWKSFLDALMLNGQIDLCIIDHDLKSGITGLELMERVQDINPLCKVIICSGQQSVEVAIKFYEQGCFYYLYKDDKDFENKFISKIREGVERSQLMYKRIAANKLITDIIKDMKQNE